MCGLQPLTSNFELPSKNFPHHNSQANGDVQRMLGAMLRNFYRYVGAIYYLVTHAINFIPEYQTKLFISSIVDFLKWDAFGGLFHRHNLVPIALKLINRYCGMFSINPIHRFRCPEGGFFNFAMWWFASNSSEN